MIGNEITRLRKQGQLKEAYRIAKQAFDKEPDNIWNRRNLTWVLYDYLKRAVEKNRFVDFIKILKEISAVGLPSDENIFFESIAWLVGKFLVKNKQFKDENIKNVFEPIKTFHFPKPTASGTFMVKSFSKYSTNWKGFIDFMKWWGLENFQDVDYKKRTLENGRKVMSEVEQIYIALSKNILVPPVEKSQAEWFLPILEKVVTVHPDMQYPPYYLAKLLLAIGDKQRFLKVFLPFARKKQKDFWVWDLMSEAFDQNSDEYFSCLCKAIMCGAPDKFTINVREKLAYVFINKKMLPQAKHELETILKAREQEGWPLHEKHKKWTTFDWWNDTVASKSNSKIYENHSEQFLSVLYADTPLETACVESVNNDKKVFNFIVSKEKYGFANFKAFKITLQPGDVVAVRFAKKTDEKSNYYKLLSLQKQKSILPDVICKTIKGKITIKAGNSFGFVNSCFVPPNIIISGNLKNNDLIKIKAIFTYNPKRKDWGWKAVKLLNT